MAKQELTWRQAIEKVLKRTSGAVHYKDITDRIIEEGLRKNMGATPAATVRANLNYALRNEGDRCPFHKVGRGLFIWNKKAVTTKTAPLTDEDSEEQYSVITSFGMFWNRQAIDWSNTPKILGMQQIGASPVDFASQRGIYLLYDGREVIYVGRATERPLGRRLYEHTLDRLSSRWDRFSWFGILPVSEQGDLGNLQETIPTSKLMPALEAILIEALEPRQNRKRGDDLSAVEYIQKEDPALEERKQRQIIEELMNRRQQPPPISTHKGNHPMNVLVAKRCGFCFGVERAIDMARELLTHQRTVYCIGPIIHNKQVVDRLAEDGLRVVENLNELPLSADEVTPPGSLKPIVLIRSHGCHPDVIETVQQRGFDIVDATCVLVKRTQQLIHQLHEEGFRMIVIGDPNHPEVQAARGYAPDVLVVEEEADLKGLPEFARIAVVSQTTHSQRDFSRLVSQIATHPFSELRVVNTICRETAHRQASAVELCQQADVIFVLGGRHSANTRELARLCQRHGVTTYHLQNWSEFQPHYIDSATTAGVTAGASTPDEVINDFVENLKTL